MNIQFDNYDNKSQTDTLKFDVLNCNSSFVNSLRRLIITEVETIGFNTQDYESSDINIIENTASLHNEFLLHRIGLIPINTDNIETYDTTKYKFILNIENTTNAPIDVTTRDIQIRNLETNSLESNEKFFPKNPITNDHILITRLKPTPYGNGEKIHIEGKSSKGAGKEHIRYSPVSNVVFTNKINPAREELEFKKYVENNSDIEPSKLKTKFKLEESERCFYINDNGDPNIFEFTIESCGVLKPHTILLEALNKMTLKLKMFMVEFDKSISNSISTVEIRESKALMKSYDIVIHNETHTLGHLIQSHINELFKAENIFVGYMNPHPLEKKIMFRIKVNDVKKLKTLFSNTCTELIKQCDNLSTQVLKQFKKPINFKPKSKGKGKAKEEVVPVIFKPKGKAKAKANEAGGPANEE